MNLKELACPIRIYWDLSPIPDESDIDYNGICDDIVALKFFTVNLLDTGVPLSDTCIGILKRLKNEMVSLSLTVSPAALNLDTIPLLSGLNVNELLIDVSDENDLRLAAQTAQKHRDKNITIGASFNVNRDTYRDIPCILSFCLNNDIIRLVFPMQRLTEKEECFYISREEGKALTAKLSEMDIEGMKITIHDPFLWRIFYPAVSFPGGGCQAANSMVSISSDGIVYPCPSMPIPLGSLKERSLRSILSSDSKKELVKNLQTPPADCLGCEELSGCMGGCSGRVFALTDSLKERDPACT